VVITWGALVQRSLLAAQQAERRASASRPRPAHDHSVRLGQRSPQYTERRSRVIIAHEDQLTAGFGAEIAHASRRIYSSTSTLRSRALRSLDCPVAYAPDLEDAILPGSADVLKSDQVACGVLARYSSRSSSWPLAPTPHCASRSFAPRAACPPHMVGSYDEALNFQQDAERHLLRVDRRGHTVHCTWDANKTATHKILEIGQEDGRVIQPTGFDVARMDAS
jgi:hypothetical protein